LPIIETARYFSSLLEQELRTALDVAESLALQDPLTGLPNRRLFQDRLAGAILHSTRTEEPIYVLTVDIDHFKALNDTYGHAVGDLLLIEVAARLKSCVREYDTVARLGGDEFMLIVTGISLNETIETLVGRILLSVRLPMRNDDGLFAATVSIGVAEFPLNGLSNDALMRASDSALYAAKSAGRDCFRFAS
jgi:diguanylate cyclase (GGDEF)-like protein